MARMDSHILDTNDSFPEMALRLVSGELLRIPQEFGDGYAVFLLYRGHW
jgi:hypothetical protein